MIFSVSQKKACNGFSLVEMLVYISVLLVVSVVVVNVIISFSDVLDEQRIKGKIAHTGNGALERMVREIRNADTVDLVNSTFDTGNGVLALANVGNTVTFTATSSGIDLLVGGGVTTPLVNDEVTVDSLMFHYYTTGNTELVRVILTVSATSSDATFTETFYGGAVLRGSYD